MSKVQTITNKAQNCLQDHKSFTQTASSNSSVKKTKISPKHNRNISEELGLMNDIKSNVTQSDKLHMSKNIINKFSRGDGLKGTGIKTNLQKIRLGKCEKVVEWATEQAARTTVLQTEVAGFIEPDENEVTRQFTQGQISQNIDITSSSKCFELTLEFGPYRLDYTKNGRFLLLGSRRGHLASFDWVTKKLLFETNVMEEIYDVQWFHQETMLAAAQKDWVYIYDNQGVELHCIKALNRVLRLEFLPYHFLLATGNEDGFLGWLDISIGKMVSYYNSKQGRLKVMTQNPANAVTLLGHSNGTVTMWSPTVKEPLAKMLCHKQALTGVAVDHRGQYMVSASVDRSVRVWDVRQLSGPLQDFRMQSVVNNVAFSQRGLVATSSGNIVEIFDFTKDVKHSYLKQKLYKAVEDLQFCPYEDVLGVGTYNGYSSLLVPGSGEPNFDAYEANPFQSKSQRREAEVKSLLEKIQPEMITLDPTSIIEVDLPSLKDKLEAKKSLLFLKPSKTDFTPQRKRKRKGKIVKLAKTKKALRELKKREFIKTVKEVQMAEEKSSTGEPEHVLDRFKPKQVKYRPLGQLRNKK